MRFFLLGAFALICATAGAQTLPADSLSGKVSYTGVVSVPGVSSAELYGRAREWFAASFTPGKPLPLDLEDRQTGRLVGRGLTTYYQPALSAAGYYSLWRTVKVQVQDGECRYEITNYFTEGPYTKAGLPASKTVAKATAEDYYGPAGRRNIYRYDRKGKPKPYIQTITTAIDTSAKEEIASFIRVVSTPAK